MIIKLFLLCALVALAVMALRGGRRSALQLLVRRTAAVVVACAGALAVLYPGWVTELAQAVGVGRGTDLVLYLLCVTFFFASLSSYQRLKDVEDRLVELARQHALLHAQASSGPDAVQARPVDGERGRPEHVAG